MAHSLVPPPLVVGIVHTPTCLQKLAEEKSDLQEVGIDLLEVRLDALAHDCQMLIERFKKSYSRCSAINENMSAQKAAGWTEEASPAEASEFNHRTAVHSEMRLETHQSDAPIRGHSSFENDLKWPLPVIATARDPKEGGANDLSFAQRQHLLESALPWASMIDIELQNAKEFKGTIARAYEAPCSIIFSHHDFQKTPSLAKLQELVIQAHDLGATIFKVATMTSSEEELERLLAFQQLSHPLPVATMGMGQLGKKSRLHLAKLGTKLLYGYLYEPLSYIPTSMQYSTTDLVNLAK